VLDLCLTRGQIPSKALEVTVAVFQDVKALEEGGGGEEEERRRRGVLSKI